MKNRASSLQVGSVIRVLSINIEGASKAKSQILNKIAVDHEVHIIHVQETHTRNVEELNSRLCVPGYTAIDNIFHAKYGISTLIMDGLPPAKVLHKSELDNLEVIVINVCGSNFVNVYKPPNVCWPDPPLPEYHTNTIYMGDFNSHHQDFGYVHNDENGNKIHEWILLNQYHLILSLKDPKTFNAYNTRGTNPDLCIINDASRFAVENSNRQVLKGFLHSHHSPVLLSFGVSIPVIQSLPQCRWTFQKADWIKFANCLDKSLCGVVAKPENFQHFVNSVHKAAKSSIPRGYRKSYIPGWDDTCSNLYDLFNATGDSDAADSLIQRLNDNRTKIWKDKTASLDFTHSSRKAWNLVQKLGVNPKSSSSKSYPVTANDIATKLLNNSKAEVSKSRQKKLIVNLKRLKNH